MLENVIQKGWKSCPKWSQNGLQNRSKIHPKINQKNDANVGPKIMIFWVCLRKGDFMKMLVLPGKYKAFWGIALQKSINNSSKNHQKIIKDSCSKKWCKKDGNVVQNGAKMGSKIGQKSIQKSIKKSMWKSMPFKEISITAKSPKLPTFQQDYLQVVYLNIT